MKRTVVAAAALACIGCSKGAAPAAADDAPANSAQNASTNSGAAAGSPSPVGETWDEALSARVGEVVTIEGEFYGHDPEQACEYAATTAPRPAKTTWDWLIMQEGRCVVVTRGSDPRAYNRILGQPDAILDAANVGRKVEISARVAVDGAGRFYLEFEEGRPLN